jgi:hypothetical protein
LASLTINAFVTMAFALLFPYSAYVAAAYFVAPQLTLTAAVLAARATYATAAFTGSALYKLFMPAPTVRSSPASIATSSTSNVSAHPVPDLSLPPSAIGDRNACNEPNGCSHAADCSTLTPDL